MYQQTSHEAFKTLKKVGDKQSVVLNAIRHLRECNDRQLSEYLRWPINRVTPRRGELVELGMVEESCRKPDVTGRLTIFWRVRNIQLQLF